MHRKSRRLSSSMVIVFCTGLIAFAANAAAASPQEESPAKEADSADENSETEALETEEREEEQEEEEKLPLLRAYWRDGLRLEGGRGRFRHKIGGRLHVDGALLYGDDKLEMVVGDLDSEIDVRRAWLEIFGWPPVKHMEYKVQLGLSGGKVAVGDIYLHFSNLPRLLGEFKCGIYGEPFGLEEQISNNDTTFMERSLTSTFGLSGSFGLMLNNHILRDRVTSALGIFRGVDTLEGENKETAYDLTCRLTALPWYQDQGKKLFHVGLAYSHRFPPNNEHQYRTRPEVYLAPYFADTGVFPADELWQVGGEAALVLGPTSLQSEIMYASTITPDGANPKFSAFYLTASHFLTGEHRPYDTLTGAFGRVWPNKPFRKGEGKGAWQVALRYSHLDLNDANIHGGRLDDISAGLNWYLNPNYRVMCNYVFSHLGGVGDAHMLQMRFQLRY